MTKSELSVSPLPIFQNFPKNFQIYLHYPPIDLSTAPGTTNSTTSTNSTSETRAPHRRYFVALTLAEGETIRRLLHDHRQQPVLKYCGIEI